MRPPRDELVAFLDRRCFEPILHAPPAGLDRDARKTLEHVQVETLHAMRRYHDEDKSAEDVLRLFLEDLRAHAAGGDALARLDLPCFFEIQSEFLHLCDQLGIKSSSS